MPQQRPEGVEGASSRGEKMPLRLEPGNGRFGLGWAGAPSPHDCPHAKFTRVTRVPLSLLKCCGANPLGGLNQGKPRVLSQCS